MYTWVRSVLFSTLFPDSFKKARACDPCCRNSPREHQHPKLCGFLIQPLFILHRLDPLSLLQVESSLPRWVVCLNVLIPSESLNLFMHRSFSEETGLSTTARGSTSDLSSLLVRLHTLPDCCSVELWATAGVGQWSISQAVSFILAIYCSRGFSDSCLF